jgi:hypothetical protein
LIEFKHGVDDPFVAGIGFEFLLQLVYICSNSFISLFIICWSEAEIKPSFSIRSHSSGFHRSLMYSRTQLRDIHSKLRIV